MTVGISGTVLTSADGVVWATSPPVTTRALYGVAHANNTFGAVGEGGTIHTSIDGITWKARTPGVGSDLMAITFGNRTFVAMGSDGTIVQSDPFQQTATVVVNGTGTVTSGDGNIQCGSQCSSAYDKGITVTLSAIAGESSTFSGWSGGGCSGIGVCKITMDSDITVRATFAGKSGRR